MERMKSADVSLGCRAGGEGEDRGAGGGSQQGEGDIESRPVTLSPRAQPLSRTLGLDNRRRSRSLKDTRPNLRVHLPAYADLIRSKSQRVKGSRVDPGKSRCWVHVEKRKPVKAHQ